MKGTYRFIVDGEVVYEQENLITTAGKAAILRYLAGHTGTLARSLAIGAGQTVATLADTRLGFEVTRAAISVVSPDYTTQKIVYKATIPQNVSFAIWEVGALTTSDLDPVGKMLLSFDSASEPWTGGAFQADTNRIGGDALRITAATSTTQTASLADSIMDTSDYIDSDSFSLAYAPTNANLSALKIRLKVDASNYYEYSVPTLTSGYKVATWTKGAMTKTGAPTWAGITGVDILATASAGGSAIVDIDGLRIDRASFSPLEAPLISRTVLGAAVVKTDVSEMDIEYTLDVTI